VIPDCTCRGQDLPEAKSPSSKPLILYKDSLIEQTKCHSVQCRISSIRIELTPLEFSTERADTTNSIFCSKTSLLLKMRRVTDFLAQMMTKVSRNESLCQALSYLSSVFGAGY
jgi:hypothetical protein